jgi:hypothetical protein
MFAGLNKLLRQWKSLKAFKQISRAERRLVFYSEDGGYWSYFEPVFNALQANHAAHVLYLTSAENDPLLTNPPLGMRSFYIGDGSVRTLFFATLDADILLMTMPDLQNFHIKRSPFSVHYAYLHHSIVSSHMIYRAAAFDHFDSILCVGPHHIEETRARERTFGLPAKTLVEHGYGRLDTILNSARSATPASADSVTQVLVAPTWGENGLIERHGVDVIKPLIDAGLRVVLRPHPRTRQLAPSSLTRIVDYYKDEPLFLLDEDANGSTSLLNSAIMVSDWSGAALEFALGLERPVIFVDVPRKVLNPDYSVLELEPIEVQARAQLGVVVPTDKLMELGAIANAMVADAKKWQITISSARQRWIFNSGSSGDAAATFLMSLVDS